jgi:hypothetical protein
MYNKMLTANNIQSNNIKSIENIVTSQSAQIQQLTDLYSASRNSGLLILYKTPRVTNITESLISQFFPYTTVRLYDVPTTMTKQEVEDIIDNYVRETGNGEIILNLDSQQMFNYGLDIVEKRPYLLFINMISTVSSIRSSLLPNLYFGVETDDFFLPVLWARASGPNSVRYLITQENTGIFIDYLSESARQVGITVIRESEIQNYISQLQNATTIFICALNETSQKNISNLIPKTFMGYVIFIDNGPFTAEIINNLSNVRAILTHSQSTSLGFLASSHPWNLALKSNISNTCPPNVLGLYSIINASKDWKKLLIDPKMVYKTSFGIEAIINHVNKIY